MTTYYKYGSKWNSNKELREWEKSELELYLYNTEEALHLLYQGHYIQALMLAVDHSGLYELPVYIYDNIIKQLKEDQGLQDTIRNYNNELAPKGE